MLAAHRAGARPLLPYGIYLVYEDNARRALLGFREHVAHAAGADADEHLLEVAAAHREEGDVRLARYCLGEERLAGSRRAYEEHALRDAAAQALERGGVLEERDDLLDFLAGLVDAGDVAERRLLLVLHVV